MRRVLLPLVLALAGYYALFGGEYTQADVSTVAAERDEAVRELARAQALNDSLRARADSLQNHDGTLETLARERFGLIRDGEIVYRFAGPPEGRNHLDNDGEGE
ncbi:MAG: septum formation initiator family protein [Gemmatimonadales bacterium]|nr:MAG: septum formation initiator family protein [Gemmatimonadales bacterium]